MEENSINSFMSAEINEISAALSSFQGCVEQPKLEKEVSVRMKSGGQYKFKYADLSACAKAAAPYLKENGLTVTQIINGGKLITILSHKSGQWFKSELLLPQQTADYQSFGSAITYLKRYSYCAILGIVADTDDDANMACGNQADVRDNNAKTQIDLDKIAKTAIDKVNGSKTLEEAHSIYQSYATDYPQICQNGSDFYNACATVMQKFKAYESN